MSGYNFHLIFSPGCAISRGGRPDLSLRTGCASRRFCSGSARRKRRDSPAKKTKTSSAYEIQSFATLFFHANDAPLLLSHKSFS